MGFLPSKPSKHRCNLPPIYRWFRRSLPGGTRWQCDECQEVWVVRLHLSLGCGRFWAQESPKPPKPPSGGGGIVTRKKP